MTSTGNSPLGPLVDQPPVEEFDTFWQQHMRALRPAGAAQARVRGIVVTAPLDVPVAVELRLHLAATPKETQYLLGLMLGGAEIVQQLIEALVGQEEMEFLLSWALVNGQGHSMTLQEVAANMVTGKELAQEAAEQVADILEAARDGAEGKAPAAPQSKQPRKRTQSGRRRS